jgi:hypothetical protein
MAMEHLRALIEMVYWLITIGLMRVWWECYCIGQVTVDVISHLQFISVLNFRMLQDLLIKRRSFVSADI